jgi:hypothetical protein
MKLAHRISNGQATELEVWVEPWCHAYKVPCGSTLTLHFEAASPEAAQLIVETTAERLVIWFSTDEEPSAELDGARVPPSWER